MKLDEYLEIRPHTQCEVCDNCKAKRAMGKMTTAKEDGLNTACRIENYFNQYLQKTPSTNRSFKKCPRPAREDLKLIMEQSMKSMTLRELKQKVKQRAQPKPEKKTPSATADTITTVTAVMDEPGMLVLPEPTTEGTTIHTLTNHLTGQVQLMYPNEVERRYRGK